MLINAQERLRYLPEDLNTSKIIFLEFTPTPVSNEKPGGFSENQLWKMHKRRNEEMPESNKELNEEAKNYPFEYVICKRTEIDTYKSKGYKYLLDCGLFQGIDSGENMYAGYKKQVYSELYIINLETGDKHRVMDVTDTFVFKYKLIMKTLNKEVRKKYNIKKK